MEEKIPKGMIIKQNEVTLQKTNYVYNIVKQLKGIKDFEVEIVGIQTNEVSGKEPLVVLTVKIKRGEQNVQTD